MENEKWDRRVFELPQNHGWTAKPGNKVVVVDRGAVRFEVPQEWIAEPTRNSIKLIDGEPPDDNMSLAVSVIYLGARGYQVDWSGLPLSELIKEVTSDGMIGMSSKRKNKRRQKDDTKVGPPMTIKLGDLEMAWVQTEFIDPGEKRLAYSRMAVTRHTGKSIHALLTLSFWPEDSERAKVVWNDVLGTLKMGEQFESPFRGPGRQGKT